MGTASSSSTKSDVDGMTSANIVSSTGSSLSATNGALIPARTLRIGSRRSHSLQSFFSLSEMVKKQINTVVQDYVKPVKIGKFEC